MIFVCGSVEDTLELGKRIGNAVRPGTLISLRGSLGAGKTVLTKGIALALGISEPIVSPTFTLVQEYQGRMPLHHLDLYRISGCEEFEMMGGEEMLYADGVTVIEWSEKIGEMLPDSTVFIEITILPDQSRQVEIKGLEI